ncbi:MAG: ATP-dependent helicase C-terminal domain-containing protein, partial [Rhodospirillaceae bacterium]
QLLNWSKAATGLRDRVITLQRLLGAPWPDLGADRWLQDPEHLIEAAPKPIRNANDISQIDLVAVLRALVGWELMAEIDSLAPTHVTVPSGASVPLDYSAADGPVLAARVQQLFGLRSTPTIAHGRFPVLIHMLSPAGRPVQVTRDLAGFWASGYGDLRKDLRGRYPKHPWPEDPTSADATNRAKPRKR